MALYIPHIVFHLARLLYDTPETFGPYYVHGSHWKNIHSIVTSILDSSRYPGSILGMGTFIPEITL